MSILKKTTFATPIGTIHLWMDQNALIYVHVGKDLSFQTLPYLQKHFQDYLTQEVLSHPYQKEFQRYFNGKQREIPVPFELKTTPFQTQVLQAVRQIPYGEVLSYKDIGQMIGCSGYRAIGNALKANPLPLVIPCHRVVGSHDLGGFSMGQGLSTKQWLLNLEQKHLPPKNELL